MKEYPLQVGDTIREGISGVGEDAQEKVSQNQDFNDIPGIKEEKQTMVDENKVNEAFEPANDAFSGLRDLGDWMIEFFSELFSGAFGNIF